MKVRCGSLGVLVRPALLLVLRFLLLDEGAQGAHLVVLVLLEVEVVLFAEAQLQEVVVERLLAHVDLGRGVLQRVPHKIALPQNAIVESSPQAYLLDDFLDGSLLGALALVFALALSRHSQKVGNQNETRLEHKKGSMHTYTLT